MTIKPGKTERLFAFLVLCGLAQQQAEAFTQVSASVARAAPFSLPSLDLPAKRLPTIHQPATSSSPGLCMLSPNEVGEVLSSTSSSLLASVPVFDGNSVVDPVVVSNAFWDGLTRQFVSLIIGQFLAVTVFGFFTTFAGSQITKLGSFVSESVFRQPTKGLKKPPPGYTGGL